MVACNTKKNMSRRSKKEKLVTLARRSNLKLRVMAEYCSSGIWVIGQHDVWRHGTIEHSSLRLPSDLSQRFKKWIDLYLTQLDNANFDISSFNCTGRALATELKSYLGAAVYVEFIPELDEGSGLGAAEEIKLTVET